MVFVDTIHKIILNTNYADFTYNYLQTESEEIPFIIKMYNL